MNSAILALLALRVDHHSAAMKEVSQLIKEKDGQQRELEEKVASVLAGERSKVKS